MSPLRRDDEAIFHVARRIEAPEARAAYLDQVCGEDLGLRGEVEILLSAYDRERSFLESPAVEPPEASTAAWSPSTEGPGATIGPYTLREQIGEGGMGVVYVAEQTQPVRRKVALKIIKPGMDTRQVIARFEAERQALAMMDHPNIARVHDGGATESGRPYFVMELVRGIPITDYCDRERLSIPERLELFVLVCRAVQHAHQKGVIHRDLKPSNILVTVIDGAAVPKVIDFGVAKATGGALTDRTLYTGFHQFVGTPLYMSPEQADLSGIDVDTRGDVYSLGVLLYELLTGTTPFDSDTLRRAAFDEMRRILREEEPPRPSARLSSLGAARTAVSADRKADARQLDRAVRGELDWIAMKALEKDRRRRYESASDLAADVMRYLTDQPVEACPPSAWYRSAKFARRNRAALTIAASVVMIVSGLAIGVSSVARDQAALRAAGLEALGEADRWAAAGRRPEELGAVRRAEVLLASGRSGQDRLRPVHRRRADLEMILRLEEIRLEIAGEVKDDRFNLALGDEHYAQAFRSYGIDIDALDAAEVARRLPAGADRDPIVAALDDWARMRRRSRKAEDEGWKRPLAAARAADPNPWRDRLREALMRTDIRALTALQAAIPLDRTHPSDLILLNWTVLRPEVWDVLGEAQRRHPDDFWLNTDLGLHLQEVRPRRSSEAVGYFRTALALRPESPGAWLNLGTALDDAGRPDEALAAHERAIRLNPGYAAAHNNRGTVLFKKGQREAAIAAYREAIRLEPDHFLAHYNLGKALFENGAPAEAATIARKAVRLRPTDAAAQHNLGTILGGTAALDEAEAAHREAIRLKPDDPANHNGLGSLLCNRRGDVDGALKAFRRAIAIDPNYSLAHENLASAFYRRGDLRGAADAYREAIRLDPRSAQAHCYFGKALAQMGKIDEAIPLLRKAVQLKPDYAEGHSNLGIALSMHDAPDEAVTALRRAIELDRNDAFAHYTLGNIALRKQRWLDAVTEFTAALRLQPDMAEAHCNLGLALREKGQLRAALAELRLGHELGSRDPKWAYPSDQWIEDCKALIRESRPSEAEKSAVP
jgi:serine/threonine protein kinase/Flp pilus assembly protein TadD